MVTIAGYFEPAFMNLAAPKSTRHRIGLYIEIPGLKMDPFAALSLAGLVVEPIRRALEAEKLDSSRFIMGRDRAFRRRTGCESGSCGSCGSPARWI